MIHRSSHKFGITTLASVVAVLVLLLPSASVACDVGLRTDGSNVTWCFGASMSGNNKMQQAAHWAITQLANTPAMTTTAVSDCNPSVNPGVDLRLVDGALPYGVVGRTYCADPAGVTSGICNRYNISQDNGNQVESLTDPLVYYSDYIAEPGEKMRNFKVTWCHEIGHAMSLEHHPAMLANRSSYYSASGPDHARDCMVKGHIEGSSQLSVVER